MYYSFLFWACFSGASVVKNPPALQEMQAWSLSQKDPLEKEMSAHSSTLAWEIPWTEETGGLQSTGLQRFGHDWVTVHIHTHKTSLEVFHK